MAHEFKRLGDVEIAETISESANVLIEEEGNIKRVSKNNVVPNNVALKSDIPDAVINPSSAVVGQTIVVKAVDETGKPTEWECADMGSGSYCLDRSLTHVVNEDIYNAFISFFNEPTIGFPKVIVYDFTYPTEYGFVISAHKINTEEGYENFNGIRVKAFDGEYFGTCAIAPTQEDLNDIENKDQT